MQSTHRVTIITSLIVAFCICLTTPLHANDEQYDSLMRRIDRLSTQVNSIQVQVSSQHHPQRGQNGIITAFWTSDESDSGKVMLLPNGAITFAGIKGNHSYTLIATSSGDTTTIICEGGEEQFRTRGGSINLQNDIISFGCSSNGIRVTFVPKIPPQILQ